MNKTLKLLTLAAVVLALFSSVGCDKLKARDQLNKGVKAYKDNHYEASHRPFPAGRSAGSGSDQCAHVSGDRLRVAVHSRSRFAGNLRTAQQAIDEYQKVIDANPSRDQKVNSAKGIAYLYLNEKKWDDAKKYYRMASDLDPE